MSEPFASVVAVALIVVAVVGSVFALLLAIDMIWGDLS
jgi:hypothetical protein